MYQNYELLTEIDLIKENAFKLRRQETMTETMTNTDYANDLALLKKIPNQAESTLYSLEQVARAIGLYTNVDKTIH